MLGTCYSFTLFSMFILQASTHNDGGCNFTGFTDSQWEQGWVLDTVSYDTSVTFIVWPSEISLELAEVSNSNYFGINISKGDNITHDALILSMDLKKIDEDTPATKRNVTAVSAEITLNCGNPEANSTIQIFAVVYDSNNHAPQFDKDLYEFTLNADDVGADTDIAELGGGIFVTDIDFSNEEITFEIDPADIFEVTTWNLENKTYRPVLHVVNRDQFLYYTDSYNITAKDYGYDFAGIEQVYSVSSVLSISFNN